MTAVMRYAFNHPLPWTDELTTYMLVMITFLGGYVASNTGALAKVELISGKFNGTFGKIINVVAKVFSGALVGWIAFYGTKLFFSPVIRTRPAPRCRCRSSMCGGACRSRCGCFSLPRSLGSYTFCTQADGGGNSSPAGNRRIRRAGMVLIITFIVTMIVGVPICYVLGLVGAAGLVSMGPTYFFHCRAEAVRFGQQLQPYGNPDVYPCR